MAFFWISCLAAGLSICALVWVFTRPVALQAERARDYSNGLMLKLIWPWVLALAPVCGPFISWNTRQTLAMRVRVAGLGRRWKAEHIAAMQVLAFCVPALAGGVLLATSEFLNVPQGVFVCVVAGLAGAYLPRQWLGDLGRARQRKMLRELPFLLDMTTLCVEAGLNLHGALHQAALHGPDGPLRAELRHALADMRAGMPRLQALDDLAVRTGLAQVRSLVTALGQADQLGMSLGPLLRSQSEQRRTERFLRAEKLALEAPVKMLFPMVFCIFPCTFLIIGFPIAVKLLAVEF